MSVKFAGLLSPAIVAHLRSKLTPTRKGRSVRVPTRNTTSLSEAVTIRLADSDGQRNAANMLLSRMYSWRGYGHRHSVPSTPNCVTFTASLDRELIGTLTLTVDSSAGLAADKTFPDDMKRFRGAPGAKICELTKFAFDWSGPSRQHLAALFHIVFIYGSNQFDCTDLFIEVNPRHRRYYEAMLGFTPVGPLRTNESVGAPSQLMWLNVGEIRALIDKHTAAESGHQRSLYRDFFSPDEAAGIFARLTGRRPKMHNARNVVSADGALVSQSRPQQGLIARLMDRDAVNLAKASARKVVAPAIVP